MDGLVSFLLFILEFAVPLLLAAGLLWGYFVWRRMRREKKSLDASRGDESMMVLERLRRKARLMKFLAVLLWPVLFPAALYAGANIQISLIVASIGFLICMTRSLHVRRQYNEAFKKTLVASELSKVFDKVAYEPHRCLEAREVANLGFFVKPDSWGGNDYMEAEYRGVRFRQSDLVLQKITKVQETDDEGETKEREIREDIFRGRGMAFNFADEFKGEVQVVGRDFTNDRISHVGWQTVETELAAFNDRYRVFAPSPVAAMTVLTPRMIEGIFNLQNGVNAPLALCFKGGMMFAFISLDRESFDVSGSKTLLEERWLLNRDIALVTNFLDTMYFKKQEGNSLAADARFGRGEAAGGAEVHPKARIPNMATVEKALRSTRMSLGLLSANFGRILFALYVLSAAYTFVELPSELVLSSDPRVEGAISAPTLGYLGILTVFLLPLLRRRGGRRLIAYGCALLLIHCFFVRANLAVL
ncbi:MAG: DUF3137 domain-containing protein [Synergistaceae bacterium]|nr:DUF3137 domain-containing protein [Synergistaceae bacterium]